MIDFLHLGQGPRPDLLEQDLRKEAEIRELSDDGDAPQDDESGKTGGNGKKRLEFDHKDVAAMIIALFQLVLPWIAAGIGIYFLFVFLLTRL
jgi:hypothetical protein